MTNLTEFESGPELKTVIFDPAEIRHLVLLGRGLRHPQIAEMVESCAGTKSSQALVRQAVLKGGFYTDTQTIIYSVQTGQIPENEVFKTAPPDSILLSPVAAPLKPSQIRIIPAIATGPYTTDVPGQRPSSAVSRSREIRQRWGLNSNAQVILTAIDRGLTTYSDVLSQRRYLATPGNLKWEDLSDNEKSIVTSVWEGKVLKDYVKPLKTTKSVLFNDAHMLRAKIGAENNFQLALTFFEQGEFSPGAIAESINLYAYLKLTPEDYRVLNAYTHDRGVNFRKPDTLAKTLNTTPWNLECARKAIKQKIQGVLTFEQACLFYIYAMHIDFIDFPKHYKNPAAEKFLG